MVVSHTVSVDRLVLVYNSDHGLQGDLSYMVKKVFRGENCALCDITHRVREKVEWRETRERMEVPVRVIYRDQATIAQRTAAGERFPCVLGETAEHIELVMGPDDLAACKGSPELLELALRDRGALPSAAS